MVTANVFAASTDFDVSIQLAGSAGRTAEIPLDDEKNNFERGEVRGHLRHLLCWLLRFLVLLQRMCVPAVWNPGFAAAPATPDSRCARPPALSVPLRPPAAPQTDVFAVLAPSVGEVKSVNIGIASKKTATSIVSRAVDDAWMLASVHVLDMVTGQNAT